MTLEEFEKSVNYQEQIPDKRCETCNNRYKSSFDIMIDACQLKQKAGIKGPDEAIPWYGICDKWEG
jgi:hypothetical protein